MTVFIRIIPAVCVGLPLLGAGFYVFGMFQTAVALVLSGTVCNVVYLYGTLVPNSGWFYPAARSFAPQGREVWLTFDDGPDPEFTPRVLALLERHRAKATFFIIGGKARKFPGPVRKIRDAGHGIGNHTDSHPIVTFWCRPPASIVREIDDCDETLRTPTGEIPSYFRAPVGMISPCAALALHQRTRRLIGWSARGFDAAGGNAATIAARVMRKIRPGTIVLLHPERNACALAALELLLHKLAAEGYRCVIPPPEALR